MDEMMDQNIFDKVKHVDLKKTMETSYIECYCIESASGCQRWFKAGTKACSLFYDRAE